jgi:hypothetical protein
MKSLIKVLLVLSIILIISSRIKIKRKIKKHKHHLSRHSNKNSNDKISFEITDVSKIHIEPGDKDGMWFDSPNAPKIILTGHATFNDVLESIDKIMRNNSIFTFASNINNLQIITVHVETRPFVKIVSHEFLIVCVEDNANSDAERFYYFLIDRGANEGVHTKVRVSYISRDTRCSTSNRKVPSERGFNLNIKRKQSLYSFPIEGRKKFKILLRMVYLYMKTHTIYFMTSTNCQHFATGLFNSLTSDNTPTTNFNTISDKNLDKLFFEAERADIEINVPNFQRQSSQSQPQYGQLQGQSFQNQGQYGQLQGQSFQTQGQYGQYNGISSQFYGQPGQFLGQPTQSDQYIHTNIFSSPR